MHFPLSYLPLLAFLQLCIFLAWPGLATNGGDSLNSSSTNYSAENQTSMEHLTHVSHHDDHYYCCSCDINVNRCNVDCCCDVDCSQFQKLAFRRCLDSGCGGGMAEDNENHRKCWNNSNMALCLWRDNTGMIDATNNGGRERHGSKFLSPFPASTVWRHRWQLPYFDSVGDEEPQPKLHPIPGNFSEFIRTNILVNPKSGDRIVRFFTEDNSNNSHGRRTNKPENNGSVVGNNANGTMAINSYYYWMLPFSSIVAGRCNQMKHVRYMYDFYSICSRPLAIKHLNYDPEQQETRTKRSSCTTGNNEQWLDYRTYLDPFLLYVGTGRTRSNSLKNHPYRLLMPSPTGNKKYNSSYYDSKTNICYNVILNVEYIIYHRGVDGIRNVELRLHQIDLPMATLKKQNDLRQSFNVTFVWLLTKEEQEEEEKSMMVNKTSWKNVTAAINGYQMDHRSSPLLFAKQTKNGTAKKITDINVIGAINHKNGHCSNASGSLMGAIKFGINHWGQCRMEIRDENVLSSCNKIQSKIDEILAYGDGQLYVGSLANAARMAETNNDTTNGLWIPIQNDYDPPKHDDNSTKCQIVIGIGYEFHYDAILGLTPGHYRIVDARRQIRTVIVKNSTRSVVIDLQSVVNFVDRSEPPKPQYRVAPSVRIELPEDFFYPFTATRSALSSTASRSHLAASIIAAVVIIFQGHGI